MLALGHAVELDERLGAALPICLQLVLEAAKADAEQPRRLRAVAPHALQRLENVLLLQLPQGQPRRQSRLRGLTCAPARRFTQRQHIDVNRIMLTSYDRLLDAVL